jgi:hypothetical protein
MTTTTEIPVPPPTAYSTSDLISQVETFLDRCEQERLRPADVEHHLIHSGWRDIDAHLVGERYRSRFDEHRLGYAGFLFSVGFSALAAGSIGHLLLAILEGRDPSREALASWITVLAIAVPFGLWSWRWVARTDDTEPVAAWSEPRRALAKTLLWCCGIVGGARLIAYVYTVASVISGASERDLAIGLLNVAITAGITVPLGTWAFRFLHKFD